MEFITYSSKLNEADLLQYNIFVSPNAEVSDGVKLYFGVKVYGNSYVSSGAELHSNTEICDSEIGADCKIFSSVINGCVIGAKSTIKPFTHLTKTNIGDQSNVGNFSSISNSNIGAKANIGSLCCINNVDSGINLRVYSGACCETVDESVISIGDNVIIGVNASIIKPVIISDEAEIKAGSVVCKDIEVGQVADNSIKQINKSSKSL